MAWYKTGTLAVTNGQTSVTGTGTKFASNARVGDGLRGPDGEWYEVINIASETVLGIYPSYQGTTTSGDTTWTIAPMQGYVKESADRLREITQQYRDISSEVQAAKDSAAAAKTSETNAKASETIVANNAAAAKTSETNAKTSETNAKASETSAMTSRTQSATSATNAKTSETNSKTSETNAKASETAANTSRTQAQTAATNAGTSATTAATARDTAVSARDTATTAATNAASARDAAQASQSAAGTSATNAKTSETNSKTSETNSKASETKAKAWATNPENSVVETGQYSALHWAAKAKASADVAAGVQGPRLTSIAAAVMAVNDILIADTTTTMKALATGAFGRTWLALADQNAARTSLGLGSAAYLDVTTSPYDETVNRVMKVGDFGIGTNDLVDLASSVDLNTVTVGGFYQVSSSNPNGPGLVGQMIVMTNAQYYCTQLFSPQDKSSRLLVRSSVKTTTANSTDFGPWREVWTDGNLQKTSSSTDTTAGRVMQTGDFGLGHGSSAPLIADFDASNTATGLYRVAASTTGTFPSGVIRYGMVFVERYSSSQFKQTFTPNGDSPAATNNTVWTRTYNGSNSTWSEWVKLLSKNDFASPEFTGTSVFRGTNVQRLINSGSSTTPAILTRIDGSNFYFLLTDEGNQNGDFNSLRPFFINLQTGQVNMNQGANVAAPSSGDRTTRAVNSSWVGVELNAKQDTIPTGTTAQFYRGDKTWQDFGTMARGQTLTGVSFSSSAAITAADSFLVGFGKLQAQINATTGDNTNINSLRAVRYFDPIIVANATGALACNLQSTSTFELTLTGNTTLSFSNIPSIAANTLMTVLITVKQGATARTLTLPANTTVIAPGGTINTPAANKQQDYIFTTKNGTTWEVRPGAST